MDQKKEERYNLIELYLAGELDEIENRKVEKRIKTDSSFAEEVTLSRDVASMISNKRSEEVEATLAEIGSEFFVAEEENIKALPTIKKQRSFKVYYRWAAIGLLLLASMMVLHLANLEQSTDQLFASHFTPYEIMEAERGTSETESKWHEAQKHYHEGDYEDAVVIFKSINPDADQAVNKDKLSFYLAIALMAQNSPRLEEAIDILENQMNTDSVYKLNASWYCALAYLKSGEKVKAKTILRSLKDKKGRIGQDANVLLKKL